MQPELKRRLFVSTFLFLIILASCKTVKPYQRSYLNDESMQAGQSELGKYAGNALTNREAASGGSKGKKSGGCGCN
jgi:hypothetical protein